MSTDKIIQYLPAFNFPGRSPTDNKAIIIDTETTGVNPNDEIIEFTALPFYFNDAFEITGYDEPTTRFNEPSFPIPEETTTYNGITNEMVAGHRIHKGELDSVFADAMFVISHNAEFDRKYLEKDFHVPDLVWGCSLKDIDWKSKFFTARSLDYLAFKYGFWFNAHRAEEDCLALLRIMTLDKNLENLMGSIFDSGERVFFESTPFSEKDILKNKGCRWDAGRRAWFLPPETATDELVDEIIEQLSSYSLVREPVGLHERHKVF